MNAPRLIIVCGVPGSGKSTFAHHAAARFGARSFASEAFAAELGAAARNASGDLSGAAIAHAYAAMAEAVGGALANSGLVVAVGSFRALDQRKRFRAVAAAHGADVTTLRIVCPVTTAAQRVRSRIALGERGPTERAIRQIDLELNRAGDIDVSLTNERSIEEFLRAGDALIQSLIGPAGKAE
jgi:predicted kinase